MNKFLTLILISTVLISAPLNYPKWINSPITLEQWLLNEFEYENDEQEIWKSPKQMIQDKAGDCEDFAFLASKILSNLGYKTYVIAFLESETPDVGHAICLIKHNGKYTYFSNYWYISKNSQNTIEEVLNSHYSTWTKYSFISLKRPRKYRWIKR